MLLYLLQGAGYGLAAAAQPGPFQTFVISQALRKGWRRALPAAFGPLISDGPIIALVLLVLSRVPAWLEQALYVASGLFVLYLAVGAFRAWRDFEPGEREAARAGPESLLRAGVMNALSPGPYIYWSLVTGPVLLAGWREAPIRGLGFLVGFYGALIGGMVVIVVLFSTARRLGERVNRALLGASVIALTCFGLYQLGLGLGGWVA